jgi:hypothetical protein
MTKTDAELEMRRCHQRLAELRSEAETLTARQRELQQQRADGRPHDEVEAAANALIRGDSSTAVLVDVEAELRAVEKDLAVNARARDLLANQLGLLELRAGQKRAAALHAEALAYIPKIDTALAALEAVQREAMAALDRFEQEDGPLYRYMDAHPGEKATYFATQLGPLRTWREDLLGDGANPSKPERWRQECRELGVKLRDS